MTFMRRFIRWNVHLSNRLDDCLPAQLSIDGNADFIRTFAPRFLRIGARLFDIGGGKHPFVTEEMKRKFGLRVVGLDISRDELEKAPTGIYDEVIARDITLFRGNGDADIIICQAVLEHVPDIDGAFRAIASCLAPGGIACLFVPSRNAIFARLNIALPQRMKERLLFSVFPQTRTSQGFPSFYKNCTPAGFMRLARENGLEVVEMRHYYVSKYFAFFVPLYALWRTWILFFRCLKGSEAAETFSVALRKN